MYAEVWLAVSGKEKSYQTHLIYGMKDNEKYIHSIKNLLLSYAAALTDKRNISCGF